MGNNLMMRIYAHLCVEDQRFSSIAAPAYAPCLTSHRRAVASRQTLGSLYAQARRSVRSLCVVSTHRLCGLCAVCAQSVRSLYAQARRPVRSLCVVSTHRLHGLFVVASRERVTIYRIRQNTFPRAFGQCLSAVTV